MDISHSHVKSQLIIYKIIKPTDNNKGNNNTASHSSHEEKIFAIWRLAEVMVMARKIHLTRLFFFCGKEEWFESYTLTIT